jgi:hypothetical protein
MTSGMMMKHLPIWSGWPAANKTLEVKRLAIRELEAGRAGRRIPEIVDTKCRGAKWTEMSGWRTER